MAVLKPGFIFILYYVLSIFGGRAHGRYAEKMHTVLRSSIQKQSTRGLDTIFESVMPVLFSNSAGTQNNPNCHIYTQLTRILLFHSTYIYIYRLDT